MESTGCWGKRCHMGNVNTWVELKVWGVDCGDETVKMHNWLLLKHRKRGTKETNWQERQILLIVKILFITYSSGPQYFWLQGPVSWKTIFPWTRRMGKMVWGWFKHIKFKLTSCSAAQVLTGLDLYWSVAWRSGTPDLQCFSGYQELGESALYIIKYVLHTKCLLYIYYINIIIYLLYIMYIYTCRYMPQIIENGHSNKNLPINANSSNIYNKQKVETTQMSID